MLNIVKELWWLMLTAKQNKTKNKVDVTGKHYTDKNKQWRLMLTATKKYEKYIKALVISEFVFL